MLTLSRLDNTKGTDIAIKAGEILLKNGFNNFKWHIFGAGDRTPYEQMITDMGLVSHVILEHPVANPYPFVNQCDIYIQPSTYEGKSNAVAEAKALGKPIVLTNFNSAQEHINDKEGIISNLISPESLARSILKLVNNKSLLESITKNNAATDYNNCSELKKILSINA